MAIVENENGPNASDRDLKSTGRVVRCAPCRVHRTPDNRITLLESVRTVVDSVRPGTGEPIQISSLCKVKGCSVFDWIAGLPHRLLDRL